MEVRNKYWISWFHESSFGEFEYNGPWWESGWRVDLDETGEETDVPTICAAVVATNEAQAMNIILQSYDVSPPEIEWQFVNMRADDWVPFCDRFPKAEWMQFPIYTNQDGGGAL